MQPYPLQDCVFLCQTVTYGVTQGTGRQSLSRSTSGPPGSPPGTSVRIPSEGAGARTEIYCDSPIPTLLLATQTQSVLQRDHSSSRIEHPNMSKCISSQSPGNNLMQGQLILLIMTFPELHYVANPVFFPPIYYIPSVMQIQRMSWFGMYSNPSFSIQGVTQRFLEQVVQEPFTAYDKIQRVGGY